MDLTIDQALRKGVDAYNTGKLQEAEHFYRAILQAQPGHPDANHNLGLIAVSVNKAEAALPLFKIALETNPKIEQFWLSYIAALIQVQQFDNAKQLCRQAKNQGMAGDTLNALRAQLSSTTETENVDSVNPSQQQLSNLMEYYQTGRYDEAEKLAVSITQEFPNDQFSWKVLGAIYGQTGLNEKALHANQKAVQWSPQDAEALSNLGNTFKELGRLDEAEASCREAIALKPALAEAHNNLGTVLEELGRLEEAEASYLLAIELKPHFPECFVNLGNTLRQLDRLDGAEASYRKAIVLRSDFAMAYEGLSIVLCAVGDTNAALESIQKANVIDPKSHSIGLMLSVMKSRRRQRESEIGVTSSGGLVSVPKLITNPIILTRPVEPELVSVLYEMKSRDLNATKRDDARYGNGKCSPDFFMFADERPIIKTVSEDLIRIMMEAVKSEIFVDDSFFNILGAGGGTRPHAHLNNLDKNERLKIGDQKYSLVYYLSEGDQSGDEPGLLKLYDPSHEILPREGMITIIPAGRKHSAVYDGKTDRVMIGVNFYSL